MPAASSPRDNRLVIAQEWIAEAMTMWFVSAIVAATTVDDCIRLSRTWSTVLPPSCLSPRPP
jgi:hypothetical protein